ncbi:MAG: DNA-directed RNA polymerase subunit M [Thermosphaera sp.]|jgi:DNA-directed RNA polymerase subunit M|nr:DNA-directed RNA polymerase subunit M [Thermosphaera sp.]
MVKFCPKCGSIMTPVRRDGKIYMKCSRCGYEVEVKEKEGRKYSVTYQVEANKRVATAVAGEAKERKLSPEEREMLSEFYEIFLEEFEKEEESEE